nr:hypothetical protein DM860_011184 [Ipomoea batatas]
MAAADDSSPDHQRVVNRRAGNGLRLDEIRSKQIVVVKRSRKRSRSDVGEAGPSNAPASSVLAVRQVRKTWKKRKDYPSLRSRSSTSQFFEALQGLNAAQTAAIIEMGFASLFHLQIDNLPTKMGYWLIQNYNPRNSMLYLADGFPRGDLKIEKWSRAHNTDLLEEWKGLVVKSPRGYLYSDVIKAMHSCENGGLWFKRHFIDLVCSLFIDTPQNGYVRSHIFHHLVNVDQIKHLNWCDYVLRSLMDSQLSCAKSSKALFTGPPLFLTVFYVDRVVVFTRDIPRQIPSFVGWTAQLIKDREVAEIQAGGFGLGRVEDRFIPAAENIQEQAKECHRSGKELPDPELHKGCTSKSPIEEENVKVHVEESAEQNINLVAPASPHAEEALEKGKEKIDVPNFELVDNNLVGCVNDKSLNVDEFDNVDSCACDAISVVENNNACCGMNGEVEEEMVGLKRVALVADNVKEKQEGGMEESGAKRRTLARKPRPTTRKKPLKNANLDQLVRVPVPGIRWCWTAKLSCPPGCMDNFTFYQNKLIGTVLYFDYPVLSKYRLMSLLAPLIGSLDWKHFFSIRESTLIPVTFEVLATLQIKHLHNWTDKVIRFSAFGEEYSLSLDDERSLAPMQSLNYRRGRACRPAPSPPPEAPGGALDQFRKDGFARLDAMQ